MNASNPPDPAGGEIYGPPRQISDAEFERNNRRMRRDELRHDAGLPAAAARWWSFRNKVLEPPAACAQDAPSGHAEWDATYASARGMIAGIRERDHGVLVAFIGRHGAGKTLAATGLLLWVTAKLQSARYATLCRFGLELEAALKSGNERSRLDVLREFESPRLLVLDDCSASAGSDSGARMLRELLDSRYQARRDTVLIANVGESDFVNFLGDAGADRANHRGGYLDFNWPSFRS
jgi:hypothetical protein